MNGFRCLINGRRVRLIRTTENADGSLTIEGIDEEAEALIYAVDSPEDEKKAPPPGDSQRGGE